MTDSLMVFNDSFSNIQKFKMHKILRYLQDSFESVHIILLTINYRAQNIPSHNLLKQQNFIQISNQVTHSS